jgi:hypothetical protein
MLVTLIGLFVTSTAIVIGADSAVSGVGVPPGQQVADKMCQTGARSVATMQGVYFFNADNGSKANFFDVFHSECGSLRNSEKSVAAQADSVTRSLHADLSRFLKEVGPGAHFSAKIENDPHVVYVAVAGYQGSVPKIEVRELRLRRRARGGLDAFVQNASKLRPVGCGARFHGEDAVAYLLLRNDIRIAPGDRQRPEVIAAYKANSGDCRLFTPDLAKSLFRVAVDLTIREGHRFGIQADAVRGPLKFAVIPVSGTIEIGRVP